MFSETADKTQLSRRNNAKDFTMAKISISFAVLLVFIQGTSAFIWERTKTVRESESKSDKFSQNFSLSLQIGALRFMFDYV